MENAKKNTGWMAYYMCDKSGLGWNEPRYLYWDVTGWDEDELKESIIHSYESWAIYSDSYSFRYEANVVPPVDVIDAAITKAKAAIESANVKLHILERNKDDLYGDTSHDN